MTRLKQAQAILEKYYKKYKLDTEGEYDYHACTKPCCYPNPGKVNRAQVKIREKFDKIHTHKNYS